MSFADLIAKIRRFDRQAEIIFDREEPIGVATDLVMPRRRWFGKKKERPLSLHHSIPQ